MLIDEFKNIPSEIKKLKNWVCWSGDKLPKNPNNGLQAQVNNPETWGTYDVAIAAIEKFNMQGIGFIFSKPYFGIDLDKCIDNLDLIDEFVDTLGTYAEYSKSKNGIHLICKGEIPVGAKKNGCIEIYSSGRFFIMTGNQYRDNYNISECSQSIIILHSKYLASANKTTTEPIVDRISLSDEEVLTLARGCRTGAYFEALYRGNWQGVYSSQNEADLIFCGMLAFWTQRNYQQIDRIFKSSALFRNKWGQTTTSSSVTYGQKTIEKAIANCKECYSKNMIGKEAELVVSGKYSKQKTNIAKEYEMSDTGNANRFSDKFMGNVKYSHINKAWYYWNGKYWCRDESGEMKRLADLTIQDIKQQAFTFTDDEKKQEAYLKWAIKTAGSKMKSNMLIEAQHIPGIPVGANDFDIQDDLINCENGIVNLRNGEIIPHNPSYMMSKISYSAYDNKSKKKPEKWLEFLKDITNGDEDLQNYLQKAVGYSLSGSAKEQCLFFCFGNGNNGKSTFLNVITDIAGTYSLNMQSESIMIKKNTGAVNTDIARLNGSRFVTVAEPEENVRLNEQLIKQMTGGEQLTARFLYGNEFQFNPIFKLWIGTNHKPIIRGTDDGIWRRVVLIPFTVKIPNEKIDKNLSWKLRKELPLIMKWAVDGCILWQKEGLKKPTCIQKSSDEYRQEMDVLSKFVEDCVKVDDKNKIKAGDLYHIYQKWAIENNEYEMTNQKFGKEFVKRFPEKIKDMTGAFYKGCSLTKYAEDNYIEKNNEYNPFYP